jgi:hypothetical protein
MSTPGEKLDPQADRAGWTLACLAISVATLGYALQRRDGLFEPVAFVFLTISLAFCLLAFFRFRLSAGQWLIAGTGVLIAWQFGQMFSIEHPGSWHAPVAGRTYYLLLAACACSGLAIFGVCIARRDNLARRIFFPLCLATFLVLGFWWLRAVPHPFTDVWEAQRAGLEAFCAGKSPFNAPFPDVYDYPPGYSVGTVVRNGMVELGFPYPPLTLLLNLPGHVLMGDFRYSNLLFILATAALIGYARPGPLALLAALLFLTTPRTLFILELGFTEPGVALCLAAVIFAACRRWRITPVLLGLLFASKQYLMLAAPCALLLIPPPWNWRTTLRWVAIAAATALAISLPMILPNLHDFIRCTITPSTNAHFRYDSLSYLALYADQTGITPNGTIGFVSAVLALPLVLWRTPRSPAGFAFALATVFMVFFALGKGAFCNYYYLIIASFCAAIAAQSLNAARAPSKRSRYDRREAPVAP